MGVDSLEAVELMEQLCCRLIADAWDAWNVVRRVAGESFEVGELAGRYAVFLLDTCLIVNHRIAEASPRRHYFGAG